MGKVLKSINIEGTDYTYIKDVECTTVEGLYIRDIEGMLEYLKGVGGMTRDVFEPVANVLNGIKEIHVITYTVDFMVDMVEVHFRGEEGRLEEQSKRTMGLFYKHVKEVLNKHNIEYGVFNPLEYIRDTGEYSHILREYYGPKHTNDTGIYIGGKEVQYGERLEIINIKKFIKQYKIGGESLEVLEPTRVYIQLNEEGVGNFGDIGKLYVERDGELVNSLEAYFKMECEETRNLTEEEIEKAIENEKLSIIHAIAKKQNKEYDRRYLSKEEVDRLYEREYKRDIESPYFSMVFYQGLKSMIEEDCVKYYSKDTDTK